MHKRKTIGSFAGWKTGRCSSRVNKVKLLFHLLTFVIATVALHLYSLWICFLTSQWSTKDVCLLSFCYSWTYLHGKSIEQYSLNCFFKRLTSAITLYCAGGVDIHITPSAWVPRCIFSILDSLHISGEMYLLCILPPLYQCGDGRLWIVLLSHQEVEGSLERSILLGRTGNSEQTDEFLNKLKGYLESFPMTPVNSHQPSTTSASSSRNSPDSPGLFLAC